MLDIDKLFLINLIGLPTIYFILEMFNLTTTVYVFLFEVITELIKSSTIDKVYCLMKLKEKPPPPQHSQGCIGERSQ